MTEHKSANVINEIKAYLVENILFGDGRKLHVDKSFQESGLLDSTGLLELITFVEERFDIDIADDELVPEHFDSVAKMSTFVERKLGTRAVA